MDAAHFEKTLTSEVLFEGRVVTLTKDTALLENGKTATREVVHHHGGACIVPYFEDGTICMVRQFRYAMQQELWELPAGKLEAGEEHTMMLRPEGVRLAETGVLPCRVILSCFMGSYQNYHVMVGDTLVKLADYCPVGRRVFRVGDTAYLSFREGCVHML